MQVRDISRTKVFRFTDRCCVFLSTFICVVFFLYVLGCYQEFLISTRVMLLDICSWSAVLLVGLTAFSLVQVFFYGSIRKGFFRGKIIQDIIHMSIALLILFFSRFIISFV